jgi:large subunit ribosomal protein L6
MNVEIVGNEVIIKNFLGEKIPRKSKIIENVNVEIKGDIITINSPNKELAGQTAANFETATRIKSRDRRVFQDGIFITNKAGRDI